MPAIQEVAISGRRGDRREFAQQPDGASPLGAVRVSVVLPMLNEALNLPHVLARLPEDIFELVVVDGGSSDRSREVVGDLRPDARIIGQSRRGKGNALECGFATCRGDVVVMLDADGSIDPGEIPRLVAALLDGADLVKGSRYAGGGGSDDLTPLRDRGNRVLCRLVNGLYGARFTDLCYGYIAFWRRLLPRIGFSGATVHLRGPARLGDGFEVETLLAVRAARAGLRVVEVPSLESPRLHGVSKLNAWRDGIRILRVIQQERRWSPASLGAELDTVDLVGSAECSVHGRATMCACLQEASA